ncbi:MAG TPA: tRNA (N6-isopentenyl adenosine(37)-C2)-methylthiotransferase MiaB [Oscillospiraceae bacterium]|nr:tRNA (N6-isopentenyl adenosine(37)-C2)-methylthiotransferase MiaB [Oscillospiraceae bacterium]
MQKDFLIPKEQIDIQSQYKDKVKEILSNRYKGRKPKAYIHTYGCQGNVSDSERLKGLAVKMGYELVNSPKTADLALYNTCAVREHAEDRVFGNVGALKKYKKERQDMIIALCGCMMQQRHVAEKIKNSYPFVSLVFGTHVSHKLPELLLKVLSTNKRVFDFTESDGVIAEGLPTVRGDNENAFLPIMYGCDNFCSYCIVPYVRGRERSRNVKDIILEANEIINGGAKLITLLGQNVNSYGKGTDTDFSDLIKLIDNLQGDFEFDFMTSHPKDCSKKLIDTLSQSRRYCRHLHLPVQCGSDRILKLMNRGYTRDEYLALIEYAKSKIPNISLTTDIIVGYPSETYEDFKKTLSLVKEVEFNSMFTFIYSPRKGTKAFEMDDPIPKSEKSKWFGELLLVQEEIQKKNNP